MKKKVFAVILFAVIFLAGLGLVMYPSLSDYLNRKTQSKAIKDYEYIMQEMTPEDYSGLLAAAEEYNTKLKELPSPFYNWKKLGGYEEALDAAGTGLMGCVTIEKIGVELPIYHGSSEAALATAVGHMEGSSLPVGGESTHCVLSAHRGLPSAKLFTDLDKLAIGDTFTVSVLGRVLTYRVDQILVVKPTEIDALQIEEGGDYCTLVTCTPYGVNTHRLLVRGVRTDAETEAPVFYVSSDAFRIDRIIVVPVLAIPMLLILFAVLIIKNRKTSSCKG